MTVKTGGPIRGFLGRWLMRIEAVQGILQLVGIAVTAASTLTTALVAIGAEKYAAPLLAAGLVGSPVFAYAYVELGLFNRKNRERVDRGDNFAGPGMTMSSVTLAAAYGAAVRAQGNGENPEAAAVNAAIGRLQDYRDGIDMEAIYGNS